MMQELGSYEEITRTRGGKRDILKMKAQEHIAVVSLKLLWFSGQVSGYRTLDVFLLHQGQSSDAGTQEH